MNAIVNGNKFVKEPHIFVPGQGTFYQTKEMAVKKGTSPNGVGYWEKAYSYESHTYYQAGNTNHFD